MSTLNVTALKHESAGVDNLVLDTSGNATFGGIAKVGSLMNPSGAGSAIAMDSAGRVTMPYQPAFSATPNTNSYITTSPIPFSFVQVNRGNHYNGSTFKFTAPVDGTYFFCVQMYSRVDNSEDSYPRLRVNNVNQRYSYLYNSGAGGQIHSTVVMPYIVNLSVNDFVDVSFNGSGDYYGGSNETNFMGYLLG